MKNRQKDRQMPWYYITSMTKVIDVGIMEVAAICSARGVI